MTQTQYLKLNFVALKFLGIWQEVQNQSKINVAFHYIRGNIIIIVLVIFLVQLIIFLFTDLTDPFMAIESFHAIAQYFSVLIKVAFIRVPKRKVQEIINRIRFEENRLHQKNEKYEEIYLASVRRNRKITLLYWSIFTTSNIFYFVMGPMVFLVAYPDERIPIPINTWVPWDITEYKFYYATLVYSSITAAGTIFLLLVTDAFYVSLITFGLGQFKIIQQAIIDLTPDNDEVKIIDIIKHHQRVIEYYNAIDIYIKPLSNITFVVTGIIICSVAIRILFDHAIVHQVMNFMYLFYLLMQLLYYFWYGNEIIVESLNVGKAISQSNWYNFSPRVKKALLILGERSKRPLTLSTGVIHTISLETYIMLLKTAYSILAIFREVVQRDEN